MENELCHCNQYIIIETLIHQFCTLCMYIRVGHTLRLHQKTMALRGFSLHGMLEKEINFLTD